MDTPLKPVAAPAPAATTPPTPPAPEPKPAPTPEEIEAEAEEFKETAFGIKRPTPPKPTAPPAADPPAADAPPADPPADKKDETPKKKFVPGKKATTSPQEVEAIARRIAAEEREAATPPSPPAPTEPAPSDEELANLTEDDRDKLEVISEMESANPERYKGLAKNVRRFWKAENDYRAKWQEQNPGESFNPADPAHRDFYRKHEPEYNPRDFKIAERALIEKPVAARVEEKLRKEFEPKLREIEADKVQRAAQPKIAESVGAAVEDIFKSVPEFEKLVEPGNLSEESVAKMAEINPVVHEAALEEAELVMGVVGELEKLAHMAQHYKFDGAMDQSLSSGRVIYPHAIIEKTARELEARIAAAPKEKRLDEGRDFISNSERTERLDAIAASNATPEAKKRARSNLDATTWTISPAHIRQAIVNQSKARLVAKAKKFSAYTKTPSATPTPASAPAGQTPPATPAAKPPTKAGLPRGTATSAVSDTTDNATPASDKDTKESEEFVGSAFP